MDTTHIGKEQTVQALGQTWRLQRWSRAVWGEFLAWARTQLPDPLEVARRAMELWGKEHHQAIGQDALDRANSAISIGSKAVNELLESPEGACYLLFLLVKKHHPDVTQDQAMDILMEVGLEAMKKKFDGASGQAPTQGNP